MSITNLAIVPKHIQTELFPTKFPTSRMRAGSLRVKEAVLEALKSALNDCEIPRDELAKEMSRLVGEDVSIHMINNCCAEGKGNRRFPLEYAKALALITQDRRLIDAALGPEFESIGDDERVFLEYGREVLENKIRAKKRNDLERQAVKFLERSK